METFRELFATVLKELNSDFNTLQNANKILALHYKYKYPKSYYYVGDFTSVFGAYAKYIRREFNCVFGTYEIKNDELVKKLPKKDPFYSRRYKCGIEVFGMKPERTKDGKYAYQGTSIKDLKESCKKNGIKGISKMDKCELVKVLMKI